MRPCRCWLALGLLVAGCSSARGSSSRDAPAFASGSRIPGASDGAAAEGSTVDDPPSDAPPSDAPPSDAPPSDAPSSDAPPSDAPAPSGSESGSSALPIAGSPMGPTASADAPAAAAPEPPAEAGQTPQDAPEALLRSILVFTRTTGFRHDSIGAGIAALERLGEQNGFAIQHSEAPADFNDELLVRHDVVVWLNTDSEVLDDSARRAFERYIRGGGGWVGVHAAAASEYDWPWYGQLLGAYFSGHPPVQSARVQVELAAHPSTAHLAASFSWRDEWYSFRTNPRAAVQVLLTLDEASYGVGNLAMGDHPIAWFHEFDGGRAWYTALGHPSEAYSSELFMRHLLGGLRWAAGAAP